ncbi:phasin family protein [Hoeflea sp. TYP-13]|uniref:phasin family protein n=1 Tax=Hoeflea sp. TYP-13 TaxID=3230023 RepID=UPI0034C67514
MVQQTQSTNFFGSNLDGIMKANAHNVEDLAQSYSAFLQKLGKLNAETMSFCAERWKEEMEVPAKIAQSKAPEDLAEVYSGFFLKMFNDYSEQAKRVIDTMGEIGLEQGVLTHEEEADSAPKGSSKKSN